METKEQLLAKVAEIQAIINKMDQEETKKFLLDSINGSVQSWKEGTDDIDWKKDGQLIMYYNRKSKTFYLSYEKIWSVIQPNNDQISELCSDVLRTHFNCEVVTTSSHRYF